MPELISASKAKRLRIYIGESDRWQGRPLDGVLLASMRSRGMAGATVFRATAGFGAHSRIHNVNIEVLSMDLPVVIETIDSAEKIDGIIEVISPMIHEGLITIEDVQVVKYTHRYLNPLPADRLVSEVMFRDVTSLQPDMAVGQAWHRMLKSGVKAAPVVDAERKVIGIVTDEDLLEKAGVQHRLSVALRMDKDEITRDLKQLEESDITVREIMTKAVVTVLESETLGEAVSRMVKKKLKRLPVVDARGKLVGVLSRLDVLRQVAQSPAVSEVRKLPEGAVTSVRDVMSEVVPMVNQSDDLSRVIEMFAKFDSHRLIVVDESGKAIGLISDSDVVARVRSIGQRSILDALIKSGKPPAGKETAYDLMSVGLLTSSPDMPIVEAISLMIKHSRKWLVVVDEEEKPLGLVDRELALLAIAH